MIRLVGAIVIAVCTGLPAPAAAQDYASGLEAYNSGDYATALASWRPLADQGFDVAQFNLGIMYDNGYGVPQNYTQAARWYRRAAEQGHFVAQSNLGQMYGNGQGVQINHILAYMWFAIALENGPEQEHRAWSYAIELLEEVMSPDQISDALARARACVSSAYQDCD
jgi:uncharacterized protein